MQPQPAATTDPAVAALYRQSPAPPGVTANQAPAKAGGEAAASRPAAAPAVPQGRAAGAREEQAVDIAQLLAQTREELDNGRLPDHPAPFIAELSQRDKDRIPTLFYQRHDYSSDSATSSVVINGKTLRAGAAPAPGVRLEEILPESVVLSQGGTQFRLRALNSWVNL
jgi:general secretion pathway protein B